MYEELKRKTVKSRKPYTCDWCNETIEKGEMYEYQVFKFDGDFCEWRSHLACQRVVSAVWDYADPYDGMSSDDFMSTCNDVCREFICPDCPEWDKEYSECNKDEAYCIDRMDDFFRTHELYATRETYYRSW